MRFVSALTLLGMTLLLTASTNTARAQSLLLEPFSPRSYGMGLSGVADDTDPGNLFYNPAVLGALHGLAFRADVQPDLRYPGDDNRGWSTLLAGGHHRNVGKSGVVGVGVGLVYTRLDWEDRWLGGGPEQIVAPCAAFRYVISGKTSIGVGLGTKFWSREYGPPSYANIPPSSYDASVFDAGLLISSVSRTESGKLFGYSLGVGYHNWGGDIQSGSYTSDTPTEFRAGVGFRLIKPVAEAKGAGEMSQPPEWRLSINADYAVRDETDNDGLHTGAEFSIREIGFLRAGYVMIPGDSNEHDLTLGLGVGYDTGRVRFRVDYARAPAWKRKDGGYPLDFVGLYFGYSFEPVSMD